ncbi:MAG: hypothetical protein Q9160_003481 [Pyrenula sp. 1 TL-2023]
MSKDSSATYLHFHSSHHADLFEEFCRPPSSIPNALHPPTASSSHPTNPNANRPSSSHQQALGADPTSTSLPGYYLPFDEIHLPEHLQPSNPEDEDDVVPQGHAAWGITRAMQLNTQQGGANGVTGGSGVAGDGGAAGQTVERWRDLGLEGLVRGAESGAVGGGSGGGRGSEGAGSGHGIRGMGDSGIGVRGRGSGAAREGLRRGRMLLR